jgi:mRNA-degrading endonuclease RelE of RelBE toxin-antitoxin system
MYTVDLDDSRSLNKELKAMSKAGLGAAFDTLRGKLERNPLKQGQQLVNSSLYKCRLGKDWRVIYEIHRDQHKVVIKRIRHRGAPNVYDDV